MILEAFQHARNSINLLHASVAWFVSFCVQIVLSSFTEVYIVSFE
jgi:hypothetical protein